MPGFTFCSAAIKHSKNCTGSLSPSSRDNQATGKHGSEAQIHALIKVVLPNPAGAETSVNRSPRRIPSSSLAIKRCRSTRFLRGRGAYNFVAKIGWVIRQKSRKAQIFQKAKKPFESRKNFIDLESNQELNIE
jgi:hypothetical protein